MALPDGWTRKVRGSRGVEWSCWFVLVHICTPVPTMPSVRFYGLGDMDVQIFTAEDMDAFVLVLRRAWRQVAHFKAGGTEPLSEEEEARDGPA